MRAWPALRGVRAAFIFLTRIPMGGFPYADAEWRWAPAHFPLVGAVLGAILAGAHHALAPLGDSAAALGTIAVSLLLTGALHEDGLADTCDALGGALHRDQILTILKDSRVGTFGACAVVLSIGVRAALLARLGGDGAWALPFVGAIARTAPVWQMVVLPYVTAPGVARSRNVARAGWMQAWVATVWAAAVALALHAAGGVSAARVGATMAVTIVVAWAAARTYQRRLGGLTGDFLGATEQLCEVAALATLAYRG